MNVVKSFIRNDSQVLTECLIKNTEIENSYLYDVSKNCNLGGVLYFRFGTFDFAIGIVNYDEKKIEFSDSEGNVLQVMKCERVSLFKKYGKEVFLCLDKRTFYKFNETQRKFLVLWEVPSGYEFFSSTKTESSILPLINLKNVNSGHVSLHRLSNGRCLYESESPFEFLCCLPTYMQHPVYFQKIRTANEIKYRGLYVLDSNVKTFEMNMENDGTFIKNVAFLCEKTMTFAIIIQDKLGRTMLYANDKCIDKADHLETMIIGGGKLLFNKKIYKYGDFGERI